MERKRIKGPHLVLVIGLAFAIVTALSGIASAVFQQHDDSPVTREVFGGIPPSLKIAFYVMVSILLVYGAVLFGQRVKNWTRGKPDDRRTTKKNVKRRLGNFRAGVYMQTLLRDPAAGIMHSLIYFSFLVLLAVTTILEINHQIPESWKFLNGNVYMAYSFIGDLAGLCLFVGVMWAIIRRYIQRPYRIRIKTKPEHAIILGVFLAITITGFGTEAWRIAEAGMPSFEKWSFVSWPIANLIKNNSNLAGGHQVWWILHVLSFFAFLVILPITMLRHMFTSPLNMYLKDRERPKGAMKPMPNLLETELESFGVSTIEDFTWKQLLDLDACTMCGRCTSVCPAHATGKSLDPREIVLKAGEIMAATGTPQVSPPLGVVAEITVSANSRRGMGVYVVQGLRRNLPGQY